MKDEKKTTKFHGGKSLVSITLTLTVVGVIFLLLFLYTGILPVPAFVSRLFGGSEGEDKDTIHNTNQLPYTVESTENEYIDVYFNLTDREIFENLAEPEAYIRSFRIIRTHGGLYNSEKCQITKKGNAFRVESKTKTIICDGETLYVEGGAYQNWDKANPYSLYEKVGIASASQLLEMVRMEQASFTVNRDAKTITVTTVESEEKIQSIFVIAIESGIVITEQSYVDGNQYRIVVTDSLELYSESQMDAKLFVIPSMNENRRTYEK